MSVYRVIGGDAPVVECLDDGREYVWEPLRPECADYVDPSFEGLFAHVILPRFDCETVVEGACDLRAP